MPHYSARTWACKYTANLTSASILSTHLGMQVHSYANRNCASNSILCMHLGMHVHTLGHLSTQPTHCSCSYRMCVCVFLFVFMCVCAIMCVCKCVCVRACVCVCVFAALQAHYACTHLGMKEAGVSRIRKQVRTKLGACRKGVPACICIQPMSIRCVRQIVSTQKG